MRIEDANVNLNAHASIGLKSHNYSGAIHISGINLDALNLTNDSSYIVSDLNFDFLTVICDTGEVFNVPREKIVNSNEVSLNERGERGIINWMTNGATKKCAITPTNDNWKTLMDNYLVCKL